MTDTCAHDFLSVATDALEPEGQFRYLTVSVRCSGCHTRFSFRGLNMGHPNSDTPVVSADGYQLRAPIEPKPGSVVGVLVSAGLEASLRPPGEVLGDDE